jgi:hypothetical protein
MKRETRTRLEVGGLILFGYLVPGVMFVLAIDRLARELMQ